MSSHEDVEFEWKQDPGWIAEVSSWPWKQVSEDNWKLEGSCPRCDARIYKIHDVDAGWSLFKSMAMKHDESATRFEVLKAYMEEVFVRCNCVHVHSGQARGAGCGYHGSIPFASRVPEGALETYIVRVMAVAGEQ